MATYTSLSGASHIVDQDGTVYPLVNGTLVGASAAVIRRLLRYGLLVPDDINTIPLSIYTSAALNTALTVATLGTYVAPFACTVRGVVAYVVTASSSGTPTIDIKKDSTSILSTLITLDANEKSSTTAAAPAVLKTDSTITFAAGDPIVTECTVAGTSTAGLRVVLLVERV